jgi:antitoxin component YwqK of YwqJK toxin-antitoxin module
VNLKVFEQINIMRSLFLILSLVYVWAVPLRSQDHVALSADTINQTDVTGNRIGYWEIRDKDNMECVVERGRYINNLKEGVWQGFYPSGIIKHEITFKAGKAKGFAVFYYDNGKKWEEGIWDVDKWIGDYRFYYPSGQLSYQWQYNQSGKRDGEQLYYHENGKVKYSGSWVNGQSHGIVKEYNAKGELLAERTFSNGNLEKVIDHRDAHQGKQQMDEKASEFVFMGTGNHTIYHVDGRIEKQGYFEDGQLMDGRHFIYNSEGKLVSILFFQKGKLVRTVAGKE